MPLTLHTLRKNMSHASLIAFSAAALVACGGGGGGGGGGGKAKDPVQASFAYPLNSSSVVDITKMIDVDFDVDISDADKKTLIVQLNGFDLEPFLYNANGSLKNSDDPTVNLFHVQGLLIEGTNKLQLKTTNSLWEEVLFEVDIDEPTPIVNSVTGPVNDCYTIEGQVRKVHADSGVSTLAVDFVTYDGLQHYASGPVISDINNFSQPCFRLDDVVASDKDDSQADFTITAEDGSIDLTSIGGKGNKAESHFAVVGRELESSMAMQLKSSAIDVLSGWAGELLDPNDFTVDADLVKDGNKATTPVPSIDPDSSMSLQVCAELSTYGATAGSYCQFYITDVVFTGNKPQYPSVSANFTEVNSKVEAVLNADLGTVEATAYLEIYASKAEAEDLTTQPYALIEFNRIEMISAGSNNALGANFDVILDVSTQGYHPIDGDLGEKIVAVSLKPWVEMNSGNECLAFTTPNTYDDPNTPAINEYEVGGNWKTCDIQSFAADVEFENNSFAAVVLINNGSITQTPTVGDYDFNVPVGSVVNPILLEQIPTLKRTVDLLLHEQLFNDTVGQADAAKVAQNRTFAAVNEAAGPDAVKVELDRLGEAGSLDSVNLLVNMLSGIVAKAPNSNAGIIGLAGSSLLDPAAPIAAGDKVAVVGSYFNIQSPSLNASLDITDNGNEDATWVLSENLVNQMITGIYQTGALNRLVLDNLESLTVGDFFDGGYAGQESGGIEIPTVYATDSFAITFVMPSAPQIKFVNVQGENGEEGFIEMQLKGMEIAADVMKDPTKTYDFDCDAACRGNVALGTGVNIPNALIAKMDVVARIQLLPDPVTRLPSVAISGEDMSVQMYEYETFIDRIYSQPALKCDTNNPTIAGDLLGGCDAIGANLYTRVQFMAALPEMIKDGVETAVTGLLESNVGGIEAPLFDEEKQMHFVMTNFGVNSNESYMTIGLDVCESTASNDTCTTDSGYDMNVVRGVYELTICEKDWIWNKSSLSCDAPVPNP